jgi:hypothetical protein
MVDDVHGLAGTLQRLGAAFANLLEVDVTLRPDFGNLCAATIRRNDDQDANEVGMNFERAVELLIVLLLRRCRVGIGIGFNR